MCAKMCAKFLCDYVQKLFLQIIWHSFILQFSPFLFYKLLMLLWNSFANSWDLKIYFLKGIVELERYEAWNLALQINDATLSNVVARRSAEPRIQWSHFIFRLQLISNLSLMRDLWGIVELEDMKHGGVAPQINAVALSNVATRRSAESGNPVASSVLGFS